MHELILLLIIASAANIALVIYFFIKLKQKLERLGDIIDDFTKTLLINADSICEITRMIKETKDD